MIRAAVIAWLLLTMPLTAAAQGVAPPHSSGTVTVHPLKHFIDIFEQVCLKPRPNAQRHLAAARDSRWGFQPTAGDALAVHRDSVSVSVRPRAKRLRCAVSGLAGGVSTLDAATLETRSRLKLGEPQYGMEAGQFEIALWGHGSPRTITLSASPQRVLGVNSAGSPVHLVLSLSYQENAAE